MTVLDGDIFDDRYWEKVDEALTRWRCWHKHDVLSPPCNAYPVDGNGLCRKHRPS